MEFDLRAAIESLDQQDVFEIVNDARPAGNYLFNSLLPNRNEDSYDIEGGNMSIRTTMAGLSGMDSEYNEGGAADSTEWNGKTAKLTIRANLPEKFLRKLQGTLMKLLARRLSTTETIQGTALNFVNKIIVQALLDREEWLKGQALFTGEIDWTFKGKRLEANYGIPAANFLPSRTGNDRYGGSTSKLWEDVYTAQMLLNWDVRAIIVDPGLLKDILSNAAVNQLQFISSDPVTGRFSFRRLVDRGGVMMLDSDPRAQIDFLAYPETGEIWDLANPGKTKKIPFCPVGGMLFVGTPVSKTVFTIGAEGSTPEPPSPVAIGYGHLAPTTEGGGNPGRWGQVYVPQDEPWQIAARAAENFLPVIESPESLVIANSQVGP